ncbi:hypothetical protein BH18ACT1_BH18ACT1_08110 [soil metagenome]
MRTNGVIGPRARRVLERFAAIVCPPQAATEGRLPEAMAELERFMGAFPPHLRRLLLASVIAFDVGARVHPTGRGRRFIHLDDAAADRYFRARADSRSPGVRNLVTLLRGVVVMSYYELPAVQAELGYDPGAYIAEMAGRRRAVHGDAIEREERAVSVDVLTRRV